MATAQNQALTGMAMGYFRSRVLSAAARLGVADALGDSERTVEELATVCQAQPESLYRLLRALASFGVVAETKPASFALTASGNRLRKDSPNSEWASVVFWADLLAHSWAYLTECIRTGHNAASLISEGVPPRSSRDPNGMAIFRAVMGTAPAEDYMPIARAWDFSKYRAVADLGGGGGALISAILKVFPNVSGMLVDRQEAIDAAAPRFEREGLVDRCKLLAADLRNEVPAGADVYTMQHVLHGYDDAAAIEILHHCRAVLPPEGRLLVIEFVLPDVVDHADAELERRLMSDLNMLAVTGGKERSAVQWKGLLNRAGFQCQRIIPVAGDPVAAAQWGSASIIEAVSNS
jgi:ubiquinone/menaquinone biosynthesis C-methylase UbiE